MQTIKRASLILALAEVVRDKEVIDLIESKAGIFDSILELDALEEKIMTKVKAYRHHDLWPPEIEPITTVMKFNS